MDLRHAPWLWVRDLSAPDPHHIIPIAIVAPCWSWRHDAAGRYGPAQQKMMNIMMPGMFARHELEHGCRRGTVLVRGPVNRHRAAIGNESHFARPRDARDDGEASKKEREIAVSFQPSVKPEA